MARETGSASFLEAPGNCPLRQETDTGSGWRTGRPGCLLPKGKQTWFQISALVFGFPPPGTWPPAVCIAGSSAPASPPPSALPVCRRDRRSLLAPGPGQSRWPACSPAPWCSHLGGLHKYDPLHILVRKGVHDLRQIRGHAVSEWPRYGVGVGQDPPFLRPFGNRQAFRWPQGQERRRIHDGTVYGFTLYGLMAPPPPVRSPPRQRIRPACPPAPCALPFP